MHEEDFNYHASHGYVYTPRLVLELGVIWDGVDAAEAAGVPLDEIGRALGCNWNATVIALAFHSLATLRALIREAKS
jgi:hypothetical protein